MEKQFIFRPESRIDQSPRDIGLQFEDVFFMASDGVRLNGWFVPYPDAPVTLLWFHGNAGNISHRLENIKLLHDKSEGECFYFRLSGLPAQRRDGFREGTYLDGQPAIEHLRIHYAVETKNLVLFGRPLGAAVAAEMAGRTDALALILETPFASIAEMAREIVPFLPSVGY